MTSATEASSLVSKRKTWSALLPCCTCSITIFLIALCAFQINEHETPQQLRNSRTHILRAAPAKTFTLLSNLDNVQRKPTTPWLVLAALAHLQLLLLPQAPTSTRGSRLQVRWAQALLTAVVPVDVVKTRIQLYPEIYNDGMLGGFRRVMAKEGFKALATGWGPTFVGYGIQGAFKFGGYEFWKKTFVDAVGMENAVNNRTSIYLASAAVAEFFADVALCPLEATRIRLVADKNFASGLATGFTRILREEGVLKGFYSGFGPILFKQVPYTMAKFAFYEVFAESIYASLGDRKISNSTATAINLGAGFGAGLMAALVSQPADTLLSKINKGKGAGGEGSIARRLMNLAIQLGPRNLFLGLGTRFVMVGGLTAFQFALYGDIKRMLGASGGTEIHKAGSKAGKH